MGRSFHWMDRVDTLKRLDRMIERAGAVALFHDFASAVSGKCLAEGLARHPRDPTSRTRAPRTRPQLDPPRGDPARLTLRPHESFGVIERRAIDVETLVQRTFSMGSTSPSHLGEKTAALVAELRAALADVREEVVETSAVVAWRSHFR